MISNSRIISIETSSIPKIYRVLISQSSTNPPTVIVLENTLGNIVWTYSDVGTYIGTLTNAFTLNKTFFYIAPVPNSIDPIAQAVVSRSSGSVVSVITYDDITVPSPFDGKLLNTPLEILVYP